jgi:hypothetical protein
MKLILLDHISEKEFARFEEPDFVPAVGAKVQVMTGSTESTYIIRDQRVKYAPLSDAEEILWTDSEVTLLCQPV